MIMRRSVVLEKLRAGKFVSCTKVNLSDAKVVEIGALAGFDCIWVDQEHIGQNWSVIESSVWASKAHNTDLLVRISKGSYNDYIKPLELDATGIMVPHIKSLAEAKYIVQMTRFFPSGRRPIDGGNADGAYTKLDFMDYIKDANRERFTIFQIEDPEPLGELDSIASLEGFDMLFFGPGDFSQGIGAPGDWNNPKLIKTREVIPQIAKKHGKFAGTVGSPSNYKELKDMGYQFISLGADVVGLTQYFKKLTDSINE